MRSAPRTVEPGAIRSGRVALRFRRGRSASSNVASARSSWSSAICLRPRSISSTNRRRSGLHLRPARWGSRPASVEVPRKEYSPSWPLEPSVTRRSSVVGRSRRRRRAPRSCHRAGPRSRYNLLRCSSTASISPALREIASPWWWPSAGSTMGTGRRSRSPTCSGCGASTSSSAAWRPPASGSPGSISRSASPGAWSVRSAGPRAGRGTSAPSPPWSRRRVRGPARDVQGGQADRRQGAPAGRRRGRPRGVADEALRRARGQDVLRGGAAAARLVGAPGAVPADRRPAGRPRGLPGPGRPRPDRQAQLQADLRQAGAGEGRRPPEDGPRPARRRPGGGLRAARPLRAVPRRRDGRGRRGRPAGRGARRGPGRLGLDPAGRRLGALGHPGGRRPGRGLDRRSGHASPRSSARPQPLGEIGRRQPAAPRRRWRRSRRRPPRRRSTRPGSPRSTRRAPGCPGRR